MSGFSVVLIDSDEPEKGDFVHVTAFESADQLLSSLIGLSAELLTAAQEIEERDRPKGPAEMEAYLEEHAGLLYQVGCILMDRREDDEAPIIWEYLYENMGDVYDQFGRLIDNVEVQVFG